jgi:hypothetical protein
MTASAVKRSAGFGQVSQARSARAKTKCGADAGRRNGSAIASTEDKAARRFAAARTESGSTDRIRAILPKVADFKPLIANSCKGGKGKKKSKGHGKH